VIARRTFACGIALALATIFSACTKPTPSPEATDASPSAPSASVASVATTPSPSTSDGKKLVAGACLSCHAEEMLAQQRLPKEKWAAEVKKMAGWGANLDPSDNDALVAYLAATYGPDAGAWEPETITAADAKKALEPVDDGPLGGGDATRGKPLYVEQCSACHGVDGRGAQGALGVTLTERPILYRAADLAAIVRKGRGKMTPLPNDTDAQIADVLAYLRTLRVP
jgi:mono/diheme cytochrome c family protein